MSRLQLSMSGIHNVLFGRPTIIVAVGAQLLLCKEIRAMLNDRYQSINAKFCVKC